MDDAVVWAVPGKTKDVKAKTGDAAEEYEKYLVENKVPLHV